LLCCDWFALHIPTTQYMPLTNRTCSLPSCLWMWKSRRPCSSSPRTRSVCSTLAPHGRRPPRPLPRLLVAEQHHYHYNWYIIIHYDTRCHILPGLGLSLSPAVDCTVPDACTLAPPEPFGLAGLSSDLNRPRFRLSTCPPTPGPPAACPPEGGAGATVFECVCWCRNAGCSADGSRERSISATCSIIWDHFMRVKYSR